MNKINLAEDSGGKDAPSGLTPRTKRLLILLLAVFILGAGFLAAQRFLFQEKMPPPTPSRPLAVAPTPAPQPLSKPPEAGPPAPAVAPSAAPPSVAAPVATPPSKTGEAAKQAESHPKPKEASKPREAVKAEGKVEAEKKKTPPRPRYSIQVASSVQEKNALSLVQGLKAQGFSPRVTKTKVTLTRHSVYLGDFSHRTEAAEMDNRLREEGISATLQMMEKGRYGYLIFSSFVLDEAIDAAHELQKKNYSAKIRSVPAQTPVYQVRVGHYAGRAQTATPIERLRELGYSPIVVKE